MSEPEPELRAIWRNGARVRMSELAVGDRFTLDEDPQIWRVVQPPRQSGPIERLIWEVVAEPAQREPTGDSVAGDGLPSKERKAPDDPV